MFRKSMKLETILGSGSELKGELCAQGTVRIDGFMDGDVRAESVIVGESGRILGNVKARSVVVGGRVDGNIDADEIAELKEKSHVSGEIRAARLSVSEGAVFDGQSRMRGDSAADDGNGESRVISLKTPSASS